MPGKPLLSRQPEPEPTLTATAATPSIVMIRSAFSCATALFISVAAAAAPSLLIENLEGPVTPAEVAAFKAYLQAQPLPSTNEHNAMVYGSAGMAVEAAGTMYEITGDRALLDRMVEFADAMLAGRNDPVSGRVLWTGERDLAWPNKRATDAEAAYSGTENGDVMGHIAYAARLILSDSRLTAVQIGTGDPHHFGGTYGERARRYIRELDRTADTFVLKWFVDPQSLAYRWPTSELYGRLGARAERSRGKGIPWNQQMMLNHGFQELAECHRLLGDDAARVARYDAIVRTSCAAFFQHVRRYPLAGAEAYKWSYASDDPGLKYIEDTSHGGYDILVYRAYATGRYGITAAEMQPLAQTLRHAIIRGPQDFAQRVDGSGAVRHEIGGTWLLLAEFDPSIYSIIANAERERAKNDPYLTAQILRFKHQHATGRQAGVEAPARDGRVGPRS